MADYKAAPYRASKEFHKANDQNWVILTPNDKGTGYSKPELIALEGAFGIMGYVEGDDHYLLFQANDVLVAADGKPTLAKASFSKKKADGDGWDTDTESQSKWKETYEASNKWVALACDFPILKALAKWLHTTKYIVTDLVYIKNLDVDEAKLHSALNFLVESIAGDEDVKLTDQYAFLEKYALESMEFLEKLPRQTIKLPPVEGAKKNDEGLVVYNKINFSLPPKGKEGSGYTGNKGFTELNKSLSRIEFLLGNADKVKQLYSLYPTKELMVLALTLAGVDASAYVCLDDSKPQTYIVNDALEESVEEAKTEAPTSKAFTKDVEKLLQAFGDDKTQKWIDQMQGMADTGNDVNMGIAILSLSQITQSKTYAEEAKNIITWAKDNIEGVSKTCKTLLDLKYGHLLIVNSAVQQTDNEKAKDSEYSILDLKYSDLDPIAF